jgi:hypothetical protein
VRGAVVALVGALVAVLRGAVVTVVAVLRGAVVMAVAELRGGPDPSRP